MLFSVLPVSYTHLDVYKRQIHRIPADRGLKVPHIGWNSLELRSQSGLFAGLEEDPYVYFVHSYYLHADDPSVVSSTTEYGVRIDASIPVSYTHLHAL